MFPAPLKLGDCTLTYPEPTVIVEGALKEKNSKTPTTIVMIPTIIKARKVRLTVFARLPVTTANNKTTMPVTTRTTSGIALTLDAGCKVNCSTNNQLASA
jgi:hypothetical protein